MSKRLRISWSWDDAWNFMATLVAAVILIATYPIGWVAGVVCYCIQEGFGSGRNQLG